MSRGIVEVYNDTESSHFFPSNTWKSMHIRVVNPQLFRLLLSLTVIRSSWPSATQALCIAFIPSSPEVAVPTTKRRQKAGKKTGNHADCDHDCGWFVPLYFLCVSRFYSGYNDTSVTNNVVITKLRKLHAVLSMSLYHQTSGLLHYRIEFSYFIHFIIFFY